MVSLAHFQNHFEGKKVFLTGHTGFKGSWLLQILAMCKADIKGYSLAPQKEIDLYNQINGDRLCNSIIHDLRGADFLKKEILDFQPDYIFHLAAQPLVIEGYEKPLYTFEVNTQGTANLLEAIRGLEKPCVAVMITTDKVYENHDDNSLFHEDDKLGGYDPYSASKAACEIVISSYRNSFFNPKNYDAHQKVIVSMRAGNVIGGGDYADNRIIPDIIKSIQQNETLILRNPLATRPWQHVLEPLGAYLLVATKAFENPTAFATSYNIGPEKEDVLSVESLTQIAIETMQKGQYEIAKEAPKLHEAATLMLDISKIKTALNWLPKWNAKQAIQNTVLWYVNEEDATSKCTAEINNYFNQF
jgi:CDP-glucose 4,6-dehydratase